MLLSADLVGAVDVSRLPNPLVPGDSVAIPVQITNQGDQPALGTIAVGLYASADQTLAGAVQIATLSGQSLNLAPGRSRTLSVKLIVGTPLPAGAYYILADIDPQHAVAGDNTANNLAVSAQPTGLVYQFGAVPGRTGSVKLVFRPADGGTVTLSLKGNGTGEVALDDGRPDVVLTGTDASSTMSVALKGVTGHVEVGNITLGTVKSISAQGVDLLGNVTATGTIGSLTLGDIAGPTTITIGGAGVPMAFKAGSVTDLQLISAGPLKSLTVADWKRTGIGASSIVAPSVGSVKVAGDAKAGIPGDLEIDLSLTGSAGGLPTLGATTVAGQLGAGIWHVAGAAGKLTTGRIAAGWNAQFTGALAGVTVKGVAAGSVSAGSIGSITIAGDLDGGMFLSGADLGSDARLGGAGLAADTFGPGAIGKVKIGGQSLQGVIAAGLDPMDGAIGGNDAVIGAAVSTVAGLAISGAASADSFFAAGRFASVKIAAATIDSSRDPRFLVAAAGAVEAARAFISPAGGGTVQLPDGSSAAIPAGAMDVGRYAVLSRMTAATGHLSRGMVAQVGPSLSLSFVPAGGESAMRMIAAAELGLDDAIHFVLGLGAGALTGVAGSLPVAQIIGGAGLDNYGALPGSVSLPDGETLVDLALETAVDKIGDWANAKIEVGLGNLNLGPSAVPPQQVIWNGRSFVQLSPGDLQPGKRTLVLVHGMASTVDKAFGQSIAEIMAKGQYDQVVGFNYDWTQHINSSGDELSAFLEQLRIAGVTSVDIEAHSEGGPVSLSGAVQNALSEHPIEIDNMVLLGSPIMGTPAGWEGVALAYLLMGGAASMGMAPQAATLDELIHRGFAQDLGTLSPVLKQIRDSFALQRPNTNVYVAAGKCSYSGWLSWLLGGDNDTIIPVSSALGQGWDLPNLHELGVFPVAHTQLESHEAIINAAAAAILPPRDIGILVSPTSGLQTTEGGAKDNFTVVLTARPTANVTIGLSSSDTTEGRPSKSSLVFTPANWSVPQTVVVTGVNDSAMDGDQPYTIITGPAVSDDPGYSGLNADDVSAINRDNDESSTSGLTVSPLSAEVASQDANWVVFNITVAGVASGPVGTSIRFLNGGVTPDGLVVDSWAGAGAGEFHRDAGDAGSTHFSYVLEWWSVRTDLPETAAVGFDIYGPDGIFIRRVFQQIQLSL